MEEAHSSLLNSSTNVERSDYSNGTCFGTKKKRSVFILISIGAFLFVLSIILIVTIPFAESTPEGFPDSPQDPLARAKAIQNKYPLIDGHNDLPWMFRALSNDSLTEINLRVYQPSFQTDIPRLREGELGAQFWSVFVACSYKWKDATRATMEQIDFVYRMVNFYPDVFQLAFSSSDIENAFSNGKIASLIGIEGSHSIDSSLGALRMFYQLGVRYMSLTHTCNTPEFQSCSDVVLNPEGITSFGKKVVMEMNRLGMLVDLSHVAPLAMKTILGFTKAPVIFSHSSAYALCPNPRNVPDEILSMLPANGGVVMVNFYNQFINCTDPTAASLSDVADHIVYIISKSGIDHVGIGSDFDGVDGQLPHGLEDVSKYIYLTAELFRRGFSDEDIIKIIGGNLLRVLREAENVSKQLQLTEMPFQQWSNANFTADLCRSPN